MTEKKDTESARLGAILAHQRTALQLDQSEIARALGVSPVTVGRWERGLSKPELWRRADVERAYRLAMGAIGGVTQHNTNVSRETLPGSGDATDGFLEAAERMSQTLAGLIRDARAVRSLAQEQTPVARLSRATPAVGFPKVSGKDGGKGAK